MGTPEIIVRVPMLEETLRQVTAFSAAVRGTRGLLEQEIALGRAIFGKSVDYSRVRILYTAEALAFTVIDNTIRVPGFFTVGEEPQYAHPLPRGYTPEKLRGIFLHELTHVWQYQHYGMRYVSQSLSAQLWSLVTSCQRDGAYEYAPDPDRSFFDFSPEQQGNIVENTYRLRRDMLPRGLSGVKAAALSAAHRAELLELHETYVAPLATGSPPPPEIERRMQFQQEITGSPALDFTPGAQNDRIVPVVPILSLEISF